ncbi:hypothetical protein [Candidatus Nitrosotalea okcheonensis]|uniref:Uncharacterized protein n=1 Tax=Candidatus Nitrosotalea okcheonensis TaxID=1903276 RepID=A0A2H1FCA4_9ARCH|nr:hypothetical protein [Candidatus Nitrosotalea okcheonensis]SMH70395.1 conserved protein of unknown function [Candidatus Nitrosotalea okcheonensis]
MTSIQDFQDNARTKRSLDMLLIDRSNEFHELASAIEYSTRHNNWEGFILKFCLEFNDCFKMWSNRSNHEDHHMVHKCMTIMNQIGHGRSNITQMAKIQNMAYRIAKDFNVIYDRL